jgi:hypothetical protein
MPIYEFYSPDTHRIYSFFARRLSLGEVVPLCPDNPRHRMEKLVSRFSFTGRTREPQPEGGMEGDLDPRQEAAMMEIAREMESMGDAEPDPKTLGRMMRRMMEVSGQSAPGEMEEMLRRLESGEDPEKLEEEFGPALENFDPMGGEEGSPSDRKGKLLRRLRGAPQRDPQLYEMSEYLPPEKAAAPAAGKKAKRTSSSRR